MDYSHLNIMGSCVGAHGIAADSDLAVFPAVSTETGFGAGEEKVKMRPSQDRENAAVGAAGAEAERVLGARRDGWLT